HPVNLRRVKPVLDLQSLALHPARFQRANRFRDGLPPARDDRGLGPVERRYRYAERIHEGAHALRPGRGGRHSARRSQPARAPAAPSGPRAGPRWARSALPPPPATPPPTLAAASSPTRAPIPHAGPPPLDRHSSASPYSTATNATCTHAVSRSRSRQSP